MQNTLTRRQFMKSTLAAGAALSLPSYLLNSNSLPASQGMKFGFVTYQWGRDWDLPTLISNCEKAGYTGVELRTAHAHGVETSLSTAQRSDVKKRFADSSVKCIGYGSNFEFHDADQSKLKWNIDQTKEYIKLCYDIGAPGIKVKPNYISPTTIRWQQISRIADSLNEVGKFALDYGQLVRVEVHGEFSQEIYNMKAIFDEVTEKNVKICWNCNDTDLASPGLEENFNTLKPWFGDTVHIRELNDGNYPYQELFDLFTGMKYKGWILLEARTEPADRVAAMKEQLSLFNQMIRKSKNK